MNFARAKKLLTSNQLDDEMRDICLAITVLLERLKPGDGKFLTVPYFYEHLENENVKNQLPAALSILSTFEEAILEAHAYIYNEDSQQIHLDDDDFIEVFRSGILIHPETGEQIKDPMGHIHLYYSVREEALNGS